MLLFTKGTGHARGAIRALPRLVTYPDILHLGGELVDGLQELSAPVHAAVIHRAVG